MSSALTVALTVDPEIPVPPRHYGGIERIVDLLATELRRRGHRVHLYAHPESRASVDRFCPWPGRDSASLPATWANLRRLGRDLAAGTEVDLVHSFARLIYLLPLFRGRLPLIQSYQRHVTPRSIRWGSRLAGPGLSFTGCSRWIAASGARHGGVWCAIPNAVDPTAYRYTATVGRDAPLVFLGRIERIKGAHQAIALARAAGRRLVIAGNRASAGVERDYFEREIAPELGGPIEYVGPVDDAEKSRLLSEAAALLFPIEWEEPFGIVMIEAMACGTPVIGSARGAVPEVVEQGVSGYVCGTEAEFLRAIDALPRLSRAACRERVERLYSVQVVVDQYERLYRARLAERR